MVYADSQGFKIVTMITWIAYQIILNIIVHKTNKF